MMAQERMVNKNVIFPSDEFCNFLDGHGSVLDSQHYIHPWSVAKYSYMAFKAVWCINLFPWAKTYFDPLISLI